MVLSVRSPGWQGSWSPVRSSWVPRLVNAKCRDNRRCNRADRRYLLVVRERARAAMRALLASQLGLNAQEVDIAMRRGLEVLLW